MEKLFYVIELKSTLKITSIKVDRKWMITSLGQLFLLYMRDFEVVPSIIFERFVQYLMQRQVHTTQSTWHHLVG